MNKKVAKSLQIKANEIAERFSLQARKMNHNNEVFEVVEIMPTSDATATVVMEKNTGKQAAFFFYYIARGSYVGWRYFVPTDSHIVGMRIFETHKADVEKKNYRFNFKK